MIKFTIPGAPQGKARARTVYNPKIKRSVSYTPSTILVSHSTPPQIGQMSESLELLSESLLNEPLNISLFICCSFSSSVISVLLPVVFSLQHLCHVAVAYQPVKRSTPVPVVLAFQEFRCLRFLEKGFKIFQGIASPKPCPYSLFPLLGHFY